MSDLTRADQQPFVERQGESGHEGKSAVRPLSFSEALTRWELSRTQADESRLEYLDCKNFGNATSLFTSAVVYAESANREAEAKELFEEIATEEWLETLRTEGQVAS